MIKITVDMILNYEGKVIKTFGTFFTFSYLDFAGLYLIYGGGYFFSRTNIFLPFLKRVKLFMDEKCKENSFFHKILFRTPFIIKNKNRD